MNLHELSPAPGSVKSESSRLSKIGRSSLTVRGR